MRRRASRTLMLSAVLFALSPACGARQGCTDDYNPSSPTSCSYNAELAGLEKAHTAQAGQLPVRPEVGRGYVYLLVSPPEAHPGDPPAMFVANRSDVTIAYSDAYTLVRADRGAGRDLAADCAFDASLSELDPEEDSDRQTVERCDGRPMKPGYYAVTKSIVVDPGPDESKAEVESSFQVIEPGSS